MKSVHWFKDGADVGSMFIQSQALLDVNSASYQYSISGKEFQGSFKCEVSDTDGNSDSRSLTVNGALL